jgi:hypothetical protein
MVQYAPTKEAMMELAMIRHARGTVVARTEAAESLARWRRAVRSAGGRVPTDATGRRLALDRSGRWVPAWYEPLRGSASPAHGGLRLTEALRRQSEVEREIADDDTAARRLCELEARLHAKRRERLAQERAAAARRDADALALYVSASADALAYWKRYCIGFAGNRHPSLHECVGKQLSVYWPSGRPTIAARHARFERVGYWDPL